MILRDSFKNSLTAKTVLILWLISSVLVLLSLKTIEQTLIYGQLQTTYGLRYSADWAVPYAAHMYSIYFFFAVPMALSAVVLVLDFWTGKKHTPFQERKSKGGNLESSRENMLISCPSCKKVFGRPLAVLDFSASTPKIVNLCPYCNSRLDGEKGKQDKDVNIGVLGPGQEEKTTP
jgi:uncharacterized Zn-finger protein